MHVRFTFGFLCKTTWNNKENLETAVYFPLSKLRCRCYIFNVWLIFPCDVLVLTFFGGINDGERLACDVCLYAFYKTADYFLNKLWEHRYGESPPPPPPLPTSLSLVRHETWKKGEKTPITSNFKNFSYSLFKSNTFNVRVLFRIYRPYLRLHSFMSTWWNFNVNINVV